MDQMLEEELLLGEILQHGAVILIQVALVKVLAGIPIQEEEALHGVQTAVVLVTPEALEEAVVPAILQEEVPADVTRNSKLFLR